MHLVSSGMQIPCYIKCIFQQNKYKNPLHDKNTHNRECKLHAQPSGENIMILELENWAKRCAYFGIKNICFLISLGYTILSVSK